jgi:dihydrofolate reductase
MRQLIYSVAVSIDGFIAHRDGSVEGFLMGGPHVDDFLASFAEFDTVVMGAHTYAFGFQYGLQPGQPAYPGLHHVIVSKSMDFANSDEVTLVRADALAWLRELKQRPGKDIWLCGGGDLAGQLLTAGLIDQLRLKVNPICLGAGIPLFGSAGRPLSLALLAERRFDNGVVRLDYRCAAEE